MRSLQFGAKITPQLGSGSAQGLYLIVSDIGAARDELVALGVEVSDVFHAGTPGAQFQSDGTREVRVSGPAPDHGTYSSFASFSDPDGNGWLVQEVTARLPGRVGTGATSSGPQAIWRARFGVRRPPTESMEKRIGKADLNWPDWYAEYMVAEQAGTKLPT